MKNLVPVNQIERRIFFLRGQKVMLSADLAQLYGVAPRVLVQAVKRHRERFPGDFMFQIKTDEFKILKSQIVTSSWGGLRRAMPYAFTEQGVAMLSGVLNSSMAVTVNIAIMRAFVKLREMLAAHKELAGRLETIERHLVVQGAKLGRHGRQIRAVFEAIHRLAEQPEKPKRRIGFVLPKPIKRYESK